MKWIMESRGKGRKDFNTNYNLFSSKLQHYHILRGDGTHSDKRHINQVDTGGQGRSGHGGCFRRGGCRGCGCRRGRGRNSYQYQNNNPYRNPLGLPSFTPEARNYPQEMFSCSIAVQQDKIDNGWKDGHTPPDGFTHQWRWICYPFTKYCCCNSISIQHQTVPAGTDPWCCYSTTTTTTASSGFSYTGSTNSWNHHYSLLITWSSFWLVCIKGR